MKCMPDTISHSGCLINDCSFEWIIECYTVQVGRKEYFLPIHITNTYLFKLIINKNYD